MSAISNLHQNCPTKYGIESIFDQEQLQIQSQEHNIDKYMSKAVMSNNDNNVQVQVNY